MFKVGGGWWQRTGETWEWTMSPRGWAGHRGPHRPGEGLVSAEPSGVGLDTSGLTGLARGWFLQEADPCPRFLGAQPSAVSEDAVWDSTLKCSR